MEDIEVEDTDEDEDEEEEEKSYSTLDKFFADVQGQGQPGQEPEIIPAVLDPQTNQLVPAEEAMAGQEAGEGVPSEGT